MSKSQLTKKQKGGFLRFLASLLKSGLPDAAINKKILGSGNHTTLIISNDDMQDLLKTIKLLEGSGILLEGIAEKMKLKNKQVAFFIYVFR